MDARWYEPGKKGRLTCKLCAHHCGIPPGKTGICGVRENRDQVLVSRVYAQGKGRIIARNVDPIEKKPLHHVLPGSLSYSIAAVGCNFACTFCQNADIAQWPHHAPMDRPLPGTPVTGDGIVDHALASSCLTIAHTYTEPTVWLEMVEDTATSAREAGLLNLMVTNGFMGTEPRDALIPLLDGANVDLKAFTNEFYKTHCRARLAPVLDNLEALKKGGVWVEVTTLVIPGLNDDPGELRELAAFIAGHLGPETPWHISRFHPCHGLTDRGPTPISTLEAAADIGKDAGLYHVYLGNVPGSDLENTHCRKCRRLLVARHGYHIQDHLTQEGACPDCGTPLPGILTAPA